MLRTTQSTNAVDKDASSHGVIIADRCQALWEGVALQKIYMEWG